MLEKLYIVIGCDTDHDRPSFIDNINEKQLSWRGLQEGILSVKNILIDLKDSNHKNPVFTWLLRVDEQIRIHYGEYDRVLTDNYELLKDVESMGDELGWHPHFYKFYRSDSIWYQELYDIEWQREMLEKSFKAFNEKFPGRPRSVRMGWDYHNNSTMSKLAGLGVSVDFSAIPGLRTRASKSKKCPFNIYDWYSTPDDIYRPSAADYRRPAKDKEDSLTIVEAPNFVSRSFIWGMISGLQMARKMKDPKQIFQALGRPTFWINITGAPKLFSPLAKKLERQLKSYHKRNIIFITYFHPDELIENKSAYYSADNLKANLMTILRISEKADIPVEFIRAEKIPELVRPA